MASVVGVYFDQPVDPWYNISMHFITLSKTCMPRYQVAHLKLVTCVYKIKLC